MDFLKRKFKKKEQTEDYSELVYLYTTLCLIMLSKESWHAFLKEYYLSLNAFLKGYTYTSGKELKDPTDYDLMIKESLLQLKKCNCLFDIKYEEIVVKSLKIVYNKNRK